MTRSEVLGLRVELGSALLARRDPDWHMEVDPHLLRMSDGCHCVVGQAIGSYSEHIKDLGLTTATAHGFGFNTDRTQANGFTHEEYVRDIVLLESLWAAAIAARHAVPATTA